MEAHRKNSTPYASPIYFFSQQLASCVCFFLNFRIKYYIYICKLCQKKLDFPISKTYS